jgi:ketosteroid isomerase-like protein
VSTIRKETELKSSRWIVVLTAVVVVAVLLGGCGQRNRVDVDEELTQLLETDRDFAAASLEHGAAEAFRMYLHENATLFSAGARPTAGRESIYQRMKSSDGKYELAWTPRTGEVARSGDMGWTWGVYTVTAKNADGEEEKSYGKYVNVWRKDAAGDWKVIVDIGNESPPPLENP